MLFNLPVQGKPAQAQATAGAVGPTAARAGPVNLAGPGWNHHNRIVSALSRTQESVPRMMIKPCKTNRRGPPGHRAPGRAGPEPRGLLLVQQQVE